MNSARIGIIILILLSILSLRFFSFYSNEPQYKEGQYISFETTLLSQPKISGRMQYFTAVLDNGQKINITAQRFPQYHYGDTIRISGSIKLKENKELKLTRSSYLDKLLSREKLNISINFAKIEATKKDKDLTGFFTKYILAIPTFFRQKAISGLETALSPDSSSLLLGIVFGIKGEFSKDFLDNLRVSGVMHVIAASGMNVTIIGSFLSSIFALFFRRQIALIISIAGIVFYAVMAGLEPSIVRASVMGILVFSSQVMGRQSMAYYFLFLAGFFMLFISPDLLYDVGFQLSFLSTLGLLSLKPLFETQKVKGIAGRTVIGEDLLTTICAQLATLPVILLNFGTYSLFSVLVNVLVLWVIPIVMIFGGIGVFVSFVFGFIGRMFFYLALPFLLYFQGIVNFFSQFDISLKSDSLPLPFVFSYYLFLSAIVLYVRKSRKIIV